MAVDSKRSELLRTYKDVVKFLLQTYSTDEVIAEEYNDVLSFRQSSPMKEET